MSKILYFEGAGCVEGHGDSDIENCRIRTAFTNNIGDKYYLELTSIEVTKRDHVKYKRFKDLPIGYCLGFVSSCHKITNDSSIDDENTNRVTLEDESVHYKKEDLLLFINKNLNCSFDEIVILNELTGYRVFTGVKYGTFDAYNYGDEFIYDEEKTKKRKQKAQEIKRYMEKFVKYDNTSYWVSEEGDLNVRINVSEETFSKLKFANRQFTVKIY